MLWRENKDRDFRHIADDIDTRHRPDPGIETVWELSGWKIW